MPKDSRYWLNLYRRRRAEVAATPYTPFPQTVAYTHQYEQALAHGQLLTGVQGIDFSLWYRPATTSAAGAMRQLPASRFDCTPGLSLPLCPHVSNTWRTVEECTMRCKKVQNRWVFRCPNHSCQVSMTIPPIASSKVLLSAKELQDWIESNDFIDGDVTESGDEDYMVESGDWTSSPQKTASTSSADEVASYLTSSISSSSLFGPSPSSSSFSSLPPSSSPFSSPTKVSPQRATGSAQAYFTPLVAEKRGRPDHTFIMGVLNEEEAGYYKKHPEKHDLQKTPLVEFLLPYHPAASARRLADLMINMTSPTGRIISQFTSTEGVPYITLLRLKQENLLRSGCSCMYSIQGYHQHRSFGRCTGNVDLPFIPERYPSIEDTPFLHFRSYPAGVDIPPAREFLNTTIGRAFVEWHGKIGVPQDVWYTITTGYVVCDKCELVRSYEADRAHRNDYMECQDIGQGCTSAIVKGNKVVLYRMP
ncbi:hypothetical protein FB451DRAFT_1409163 [Mycena latifolia]|nr:hypothetical protein FB451DRAFT_1409163 [Mycena latifolia]